MNRFTSLGLNKLTVKILTDGELFRSSGFDNVWVPIIELSKVLFKPSQIQLVFLLSFHLKTPIDCQRHLCHLLKRFSWHLIPSLDPMKL